MSGRRARIAIPMHFWEQELTLREFLRGLPRARWVEGDTLRVSRESLPREMEVVVLRHRGWVR